MPVHSISIDSEGMEICKASNDCQYFPFAGVILPDSQEKADAIADWIQEQYLDTRMKLNDPELRGDPARESDPDLPNFFWEGPGSPGQTDLVARAVLVTIEWTGSEYYPTLRRIR